MSSQLKAAPFVSRASLDSLGRTNSATMAEPTRRPSIAERIGNKVQDAKDHVLETGDRVRILMKPLQHTRMLTFVCFVNFVLLIVAVSSNRMIWAHNAFDDDTNPHYNVGLWKVDFGGPDKLDVCKDWPATKDKQVCANVDATRAMLILATLTNLLGIIGGLVRTNTGSAFWPVQTIYPLLASIMFSMLAYLIWQGGVQDNFERELAASVEATVTVPTTVAYKYYSTLGYSYGIALWCWVWPMSVLAVKVVLPLLEFEADDRAFNEINHDNHVHRDHGHGI
eukprot:m.336482 g.336482  ORF g.336482 m.336482 type:complete len:281 (+) comp17865_c0_seq1:113-955(+)